MTYKYRGFDIDQADYGYSYALDDLYDGAPDADRFSSRMAGWCLTEQECLDEVDDLHAEYEEILKEYDDEKD